MWTIVAIVIIAIGGGTFYATQKSNSNQVDASYNTALQKGKDAVAAKNYTKASSAFAQAVKIKKTSEASAYQAQAENMLAAISSTKSGKYDTALAKADNVINKDNGYSVLVKQGQKLKVTIKDVQDNYEHEIKPLFETATKAEDDKQYIQAIDQYQKVLDLPYINGQYYAKYKKQAEKGAATNKKLADENDNGAGATIRSYRSNSSKQNQDTGNAGKTGEGAVGNHKVHGKTVTNKEISQLRKRVTKLGYDGMSFSPQDLIDLYRKSGRSNPNKITKNDVANYLKP